MIEVFQIPFMAQALLACVVLAAILSYFGIHVVLRRIVFVDLAIAQISSVGVATALLVGANATLYSLLFTLLGASLFSIRVDDRRVPQEAVIGIVYAVASAAAILIVSKSPHGEADVLNILFGNILAVGRSQIREMVVVFAAIGAFHALYRDRFFKISQDHEAARREGTAVRWWDLLFYITLGIIIALAIRTGGVLLVFSYLIVPAVATLLFTRRLAVLYLGAFGGGLVASVVGLYTSFRFDSPPGPTIILIFGAILLLAALARWATRSSKREAVLVIGLASVMAMMRGDPLPAEAGAIPAAWGRGPHKVVGSPEEAVEAVKRAFPEVAEVPTCPGGRIGCQGDIRVRPGERKGDWRVVVWEGWEDCPAGCIDNRWRYFVVKRDGAVSEVGRYERIYDAATNAFRRTGEPLWGDPSRP